MTEEEADTEDVAAEADEAEDESTEGVQDGDFVKLDYTARTVENDQLVDTTSEEVAEEEGINQEEQDFSPRTIVLGEGHIFDTVEDDVRGKAVGDTGSVTVPAAEAFGEYDEDDVRTISAEKIPEDDRRPGAQVQIDGEEGFVNTIIGGRARVDFNHPLAGDDVEYEYEILDVVDDEVEKASALFEMFFELAPEMWIDTDEVEEETMVEPDEDAEEDAEPEFETETVEKRSLYVESVPQLQMNQQWMFGKQQVAQQIMEHIDIDRVVVQEVIDGGGMGGMMGGMGGMMGGMGGGEGADAEAVEEELEDADVDADEIAAELDEE